MPAPPQPLPLPPSHRLDSYRGRHAASTVTRVRGADGVRGRYEKMAKLLVNAKAGIEHLADRLEVVKTGEGTARQEMSDETVLSILQVPLASGSLECSVSVRWHRNGCFRGVRRSLLLSVEFLWLVLGARTVVFVLLVSVFTALGVCPRDWV
eukprot:337451-Rhodomonas_salina.2